MSVALPLFARVPLRRTAARRPRAVLALLLLAPVLALGTAAPAEAALVAQVHTCTGEIKEPATVTIDTDAPPSMYVGEHRTLEVSSTLKFPGKTTYALMLAWGEGRVWGSGTFKVDVGTTAKAFTSIYPEVRVKAGYLVDGSDSNPIVLASTDAQLGVTAPATPGILRITESRSGGKSVDVSMPFHRKALGADRIRTARCVHTATENPVIDSIVVRSRSALQASLTPAVLQQNSRATATATVTVDGGRADGTVTYTDAASGEEIAKATVVDGAATVALPALPVGTHRMLAEFVPSDRQLYDGSTTGPLTLEVRPAQATTVALALDRAEIAPSESATATATVSSATGPTIPEGRVDFLVDGVVHGRPLDRAGRATFAIADLGEGDHPVRATFVPTDSDTWAAGAPASRVLRVVRRAADSTTSVELSHNPASTNDPVRATARVRIEGGLAPAGDVEFTITGGSDGQYYDLVSVPVAADGTAGLDLSSLPEGRYQVLADFQPTRALEQKQSAAPAVTLVVQQPSLVQTTATLALSPTPQYAGDATTATATVSAVDGSHPAGSVLFTVDGVETPVALPAGAQVATLAVGALSAGSHVLTARFVPQDAAVYAASQPSPATELTLSKRPPAQTTTRLVLTDAAIGEDQATTAVATVTAAGGVPLAGELEFTVGGTVHRHRYRPGGSTLELADLPVGAHEVSVRFVPAPDLDVTDSADGPHRLSVTAAPPATTRSTLSLSRTTATTRQPVVASVVVASTRGAARGEVVLTRDGGVPVDTVRVGPGTARATTTLTGLPVGTRTVTAAFRPDDSTRFAGTQDTRTVEVRPAPMEATVTTLLLSPETTAADGTVSATAEVAGPGESPQGTVTFSLHGRSSPPTPVTGGVATAPVPAAPGGGYEIGASDVVAVFTPEAGTDYLASTDTQPLLVTAPLAAAPTTTVLSMSRTAITTGETTTVTARVGRAGTAPEGTVVFGYRGAQSTVPVVEGRASLDLTGTATGTEPVTADFDPADPSVAASSATANLVVSAPGAARTSTRLTIDVSEATPAESVLLRAQVDSAGSLVPGRVEYAIGARTLTSVVDAVTGLTSVSVTDLPVGEHAVGATFVPDDPGRVQGSQSRAIPLRVVASSSIELHLAAEPVLQGTPVTASCSVTTRGGPAAGTVTFLVGGREITATVAAGTASAVLPELAPGNYAVRARFAPADTAMRPSVAAPRELTVLARAATEPPAAGPTAPAPPAAVPGPAPAPDAAREPTTVALQAPSRLAHGQPLLLSARVPDGLEGHVQFAAGGFEQDVVVQAGAASFTAPSPLAVGTHALRATFVPSDGRFAPSATAGEVTVLKDRTTIRLGKRWTPRTGTLQVRARVRGVFRTAGAGQVTFSLRQGRRTVSTVTRTLDANAVVETVLPTRGRRGRLTLTVAFAGSDALSSTTSTKTLRIR